MSITKSAFGRIAIKKPATGDVETGCRAVIQAPNSKGRIMRYGLTDHEWATIRPVLPNKPRNAAR